MKVIHKYEVPTIDVGTEVIKMPEGAVILSAGQQGNKIYIWALVDPMRDPVPYYILVQYTGVYMPDGQPGEWKFIGTVFVGPLVLHLFQYYKPKK